MSRGRPSKAERAAWAELLGDEGRTARRVRVRIGAIALIAVMVVGGFWVVGKLGATNGSCPDPADLKAFWAKPKAQVDQAQADTAIEETMRCIDMVGKTREQIQASIGDWTAVTEYEPARRNGRASFLVWSNGNRSDGVRVDFSGNGKARSAQEYRP